MYLEVGKTNIHLTVHMTTTIINLEWVLGGNRVKAFQTGGPARVPELRDALDGLNVRCRKVNGRKEG